MKFKTLSSVYTNNFTDVNIKNKILSLWNENKTNIETSFEKENSIACIYHKYQSDFKGDYTASICIENENGDFDSKGYIWKEYKIENDKNTLDILSVWKKIWCDETKGIFKRVYDFDFELYKANGEVSIFVAVF